MSPSTSISRSEPKIPAPRISAPEARASQIRDALQFRCAFQDAVRRLAAHFEPENIIAEFPFIEPYLEEEETERPSPHAGPLLALQTRAALDATAIGILFTVGLIEEDPRFGPLIEWAQPGADGQQRPTVGLLTACFREPDECIHVRESIRQLTRLGLIEVVNPEAPRIFWAFRVVPLLWDVLRGEYPASTEWFNYWPREKLTSATQLVLPESIRSRLVTLPNLLREGRVRCVLVRGPQHNGRKTLLHAIAGAAGYSVIERRVPLRPDDPRLPSFALLATLLDAMPIMTYELAPGETAILPELRCFDGPQGIAISRQGCVSGSAADSAIALDLPFPDLDARQQLWSLALRRDDPPDWTRRFLLTSGGILRAAALASAQAALESGDRTPDARPEVQERDVQDSLRALQQPLENQAVRLTPFGGWDQIVVSGDVLAELRTLESRCRLREDLPRAAGPALGSSVNRGVRALLSGPSGTGKTLAARVLAAELQIDLYRLDLSSLVNKYVGETEKNLNQVLSRAEELNVILLLDEGDALLTNRTAVQSSNDRYANLETNFLLQRIESFEGILLITTNALQRIDTAFQRRMDVMIEFRLPEPEERWHLWHLHLPPGHMADTLWLEEAATRCNLSGGQIRNAALHASLLALDAGRSVSTTDVERSIHREYRKMGAVCPLRRSAGGR